MKIRGKLLILLLCVGLLPLLIGAVLDGISRYRLGIRLANESRDVLAENAHNLLRDLVHDFESILNRDKKLLELMVTFQAREVENRLGVHRDRLSLPSEVHRRFYDMRPQLIHRQHTVLESGFTSSYPPGKDDPQGADLRRQLWYQRTRRLASLAWTAVPETAERPLGLVVATPLYRHDGSFAGMTAIEVRLAEAFRELKHPAQWGDEVETLLLRLDDQGGSEGERLVVELRNRGQASGAGWHRPLEPQYLWSEDEWQQSALIKDVVAGKAGVRRMPYAGRESLWAYGERKGSEYFPMIIVPYQRVIAQATAARRYVMAQTMEGVKITGLLLLGVAVAAVLLALYCSRSITRPVLQLAGAATRLAGGDFQAQVQIRTGDEFEELGGHFNSLGPQLSERERMRQALTLAKEVQQHLLPHAPPRPQGFDIAGTSEYCEETGGDYYDFLELEQSKLGLVVGDVSGHGVGAALLMASAKGVLRAVLDSPESSLEKALHVLNRHLLIHTDEAEFMTLFYGVLNVETRSFQWSSAGHGPVFWYRKEDLSMHELPTTGPPLGILEGTPYRSPGPIVLAPGDLIVIGTDGVWETQNRSGEMFGTDRFHSVLRAVAEETAQDICASVMGSVRQFRQGGQQVDDITLVVVKVV